ncbi:hypothetical protein HJB86_32260 [Rhizobium sp. NZLR3b]|jgi:predicted alpha/beta superfamily hydrolase|uniref:hypothetical protein n=1 Tax=Rhizobium sp. NZLR3b TaxID=2731101 RepID=UPI001C8367D3|nr:hypothetical protein [Rhizobium sp. NZLR3b]MBX5193509.1 hypothetical protein [Rhizobium sp. NZLR3b]
MPSRIVGHLYVRNSPLEPFEFTGRISLRDLARAPSSIFIRLMLSPSVWSKDLIPMRDAHCATQELDEMKKLFLMQPGRENKAVDARSTREIKRGQG